MWKRRRHDELESVNLLELTPVRLAEWTERGDRVVLERPRPAKRGPAGLVERLLFLLSARRIRLDALGSYAWLRIDGKKTVGQVATVLREEFGSEVEPVEDRLGHLVRILRSEGLVAYRGWDDALLAKSAGASQSD